MSSENQPPDDPFDDAPETGEDDDKRGFVPDFVRRMAWAGLGAVFMSEEGIRRFAGQVKLPKEALAFLMSQAEKTKDEVGRVLSDEVRKLLQSDRLQDELVRAIASTTIEIKASVRLVPDSVREGPRIKVAEVKAVKRKKDDEDE
jgi:hypothetical protein